jgi:iron(III) transport system permease protein
MVLSLSVLVSVPIVLLLLNSFRHVTIGTLGFNFTDFTFLNYVEAYSNPKTYTMLLNSLWFAFGSMLLATVFGFGLAFLSERTDLRFRDAIPVMVMVPLIMPSLVKALAWVFLMSPDIGLLNGLTKWLGLGSVFNAYSIPNMIWVEGISMSVLAYLLIAATLRRMDPSLEEAALGSGATMWKTQMRVTFPLLMPALAGVMLLLFIRGLEAFEVPLALGMGRGIYVFSTNIFYTLHGTFPPDYGLGFAYGVTLMVLAVAALIVYQAQLARAERYTVVTGKGYRPRRIHLEKTGRLLGWGFMGFYGLVAILLPLFILVWGSILPYYKQPSIEALQLVTFKYYISALKSPLFYDAIGNTLILGGVSSVAIMFLAVIASWFIYRTNIGGRRILDFVIFMPYAVSSVVIAVGFLIFFLWAPAPISYVYGTIWIIVIAYTIRYLPQGSRFTHAAIVQIHKELEEAAWAAGANFWQTLRKIWLPLILPALINGGLFVFVLAFKVMSIAAFLQSPDNMVLSVYLWNRWSDMGLGWAAALAVIMIVVLAILTFASRRFGAIMMRGTEA